jgi:hypothetical protein
LTQPAAPAPAAATFVKALGVACAVGVLTVGIGVSSCLAVAQPQAQPPALPGVVAQAGRPAAKTPTTSAKSAAKSVIRPLWTELTPQQHQALAPLAAKWDTLSEAQKRKWLALSRNFPKLSQPEQATLHSRMTEWAALSPQQRTQARLNFGETRQLSPDDKKAKWEAYQALSPEEKSKLAAGVTKPPATAAAVRPVTPRKLAVVPKPANRQDSKVPRIAAAPHQVEPSTLLPQQPPAAMPAPMPAPLPAPAAMPVPAPAPIPAPLPLPAY